MKTSLVITTFNRPDALKCVLKSVANQSITPAEIVVADDGSSKETKDLICNCREKYKLNIIHSWQENKGVRISRSRNKAISLCSSEYIVLIDGDMVLDSFFLKDHIESAEKNFFIQGSRVLLSESLTNNFINSEIKLSFFSKGLSNRKNSIRSKLLSNLFSRKSKKMIGIKACNFSFFKEDFYKVNGFDNNIEGWGKEDSELVARFFNYGIERKNLKFKAVQFHLWHKENSRHNLQNNEKVLKKSISKKIMICQNGVNQCFEEP